MLARLMSLGDFTHRGDASSSGVSDIRHARARSAGTPRIDFASSPTLETELQKAENALPGRMVLNLASLKFIDSTGIHLLAHAQQRADAAAHRLVLTHVPPHARRLFSLTGIDARVSIE
jgi:anti-anti-sigma factor